MGPLTWRELAVIVRRAPVWVAGVVHVLMVACFVIAWGQGIPVVGRRTPWDQFIEFECAVLVILLPWTAVRCAAMSRRDLTALGLATASAPSRLLIAKAIALGAALLLLAVASMPVGLLMQQIAAVPLMSVAVSVAPIAGLVVFTSSASTAAILMFGGGMLSWIAATGLTVVAWLMIPATSIGIPVWGGATVLLMVPVLAHADAGAKYLAKDLL